MSIKITASEQNVRLQRLSEDDTMFVSFEGSIVHLRMYANRLSAGNTEAVFYYCASPAPRYWGYELISKYCMFCLPFL